MIESDPLGELFDERMASAEHLLAPNADGDDVRIAEHHRRRCPFGELDGLPECAQLALLVRERLERIGLRTAPVTSGSKGMQLYAALPGEQDSGTICDIAREIAQELTRLRPELVLWKMTKSLRPGKVLLDWSQNAAAKTTIAPYSLRGKEAPLVAAPRTWAEIERGAERRDFLTQLDMDDVLARVASDGDLFAAALGQP